MLEVNGDDPKNQNVNQNLEDEENIHVHLLPMNKNLLNSVCNLCERHNYALEAKIYTFCYGISISQ